MWQLSPSIGQNIQFYGTLKSRRYFKRLSIMSAFSPSSLALPAEPTAHSKVVSICPSTTNRTYFSRTFKALILCRGERWVTRT